MLVLPAVTACHVPSRHWHVSCVWLALRVLAHDAPELRAGVVQGALDGSLAHIQPNCDGAQRKISVVVKGDDLAPARRKLTEREFEESSRARIGWRREAVRGVKKSLRSRATKPDVSTPSNALTMRRCDDRHALRHDLGGDRARGSRGHRDAQRTTSATP